MWQFSWLMITVEAQSTKGGACPGQVVLGCIERQTEQIKGNESISSTSLFPALTSKMVGYDGNL